MYALTCARPALPLTARYFLKRGLPSAERARIRLVHLETPSVRQASATAPTLQPSSTIAEPQPSTAEAQYTKDEARLLDTWLLSRGAELLLTPGSTMGYLALALADDGALISSGSLRSLHASARGDSTTTVRPPAVLLHTCAPPPSREASFHLLPKALKRSAVCARSARELASEPSARMRSLWTAARQHW